MDENKNTGCIRVITIGSGIAAIVGVFISICAWLSPFNPVNSSFVHLAEPTKPPPPSPTPCIWSMEKSRVAAIKFFESGEETITRSDRIYENNFSSASTRFINWELTLDHECPPEEREDFVVQVTYFNPDGTVFTNYSVNTYVDAGWTKSTHSSGWGWEKSGNWPEGKYRVELEIIGKVKIVDTFKVVP
jgi:hypothetical protein